MMTVLREAARREGAGGNFEQASFGGSLDDRLDLTELLRKIAEMVALVPGIVKVWVDSPSPLP